MNSFIIILIVSLSFLKQDIASNSIFNKYLDKQFGNSYEDLGEFENEIQNKDFSNIWTTKVLNVDSTCFGTLRSEPLGYIGNDYQRIRMHFSGVEQDELNFKNYIVSGKSNVKNNICDFTGIFKVQSVREFKLSYQGECSVYNSSKTRHGIIIGSYELQENQKQNLTGVFNGYFISCFVIEKDGSIEYNTTDLMSDNYVNNQFIGSWTPYLSKKTKKCNWGDFRIPNSSELDIGAGFFSPNDKYLDKGWESYCQAIINNNPKVFKIEQNEWWK